MEASATRSAKEHELLRLFSLLRTCTELLGIGVACVGSMRPEDLSVNHLADSFGNAARALIRISFPGG